MLKEKNQFGVLSSEDDTEDCKMDSKPKSCISTSEDTQPDCEIISSQSNLLNNQSTYDTSTKSTRDSPIIIVGDSIIKQIEPRKISRKKTIKRTYPGKTADEIKSEVESIKLDAFPSHIIVHAGTNDLPGCATTTTVC